MSMNKQDLERGLAAYKQEKKRSTLKFVLLAAVGICAFLLIWQLIVQFKLVNVRSLPSPVKVLQTLIKKISTKNPDGNTLGTNILASLQVLSLIHIYSWKGMSINCTYGNVLHYMLLKTLTGFGLTADDVEINWMDPVSYTHLDVYKRQS